MPSIGQTWVLASIGAVVEMGILSTLKWLLIESYVIHDFVALWEVNEAVINIA
jgi:hypothetical protein